MSAIFNKDLGFVFIYSGELEPEHGAILESVFEEQTDEDEKEIMIEQHEAALYVKVCLVSTFLLPFELPLTYLFMGKRWVIEKLTMQRIYWKYITGKIKYTEFKNSLKNLLK